MRVLDYLANVLRAEFLLVLSDIIRRKVLIALFIAYPYILALFIVLIGSSIGSYNAFKVKLGIDPLLFFIIASYLMMTVLSVIDEVLWRPVHDSMVGTASYIMIAPISKVIFYSLVPLPRLILSTLIGASSVLPVSILFYGFRGVTITGLVTALALVSSLLLLTFSTLLLGTFYYLLGENWRLLNILRPILLIVTGVYYPRFLMPLALKILSSLLPSSNTIELLYRSLLGIHTEAMYALTLVGIAIALTLAYLPLSSITISLWERKNLVRGSLR